jgi:hypothetical protein
VQAAEGVLEGREFQFSIARSAQGDVLTLKIPAGASGLAERLAQAVKQAAGVTPSVELADGAAFSDPSKSWKTKRVVDLRE